MTRLLALFKRYHFLKDGDPAVERSMAKAWAHQIELWATMQIKFHNWTYHEVEKVVNEVRDAQKQEN